MTTYAKAIQPPKNKAEGLQNFIQMIINSIEAGNEREALLTAVDVLDALKSGIYKEDQEQSKNALFLKAQQELQAGHSAEIVKVGETAFEKGYRKAQDDMRAKLGL